MRHPEIQRLSDIAEDAAHTTQNVPRLLTAAIMTAAKGPVEPALVIGVLIEGIAHILSTAIPAELASDYRTAAVHLLTHRLDAATRTHND
jgi:hypothetical protein